MARREFLIIDGYNLLHLLGRVKNASVPGNLRRARNALIGQLTNLLDADQQARTTLVFDSREAVAASDSIPPATAITVAFATEFENADAYIEQLLNQHSAPKQVVVVSSDRQVQQAARRRRAKHVESTAWFDRLLANRKQRSGADGPKREDGELADKPIEGDASIPMSDAEREYWLREFGDQL